MRRDIRYKLHFNDQVATREQLDRVDSITVEQEVDTAWEARLKVPVCLDPQGRWRGTDQPFMQPSARVRVEVSVVRGQFVPLIDGPVVAVDSQMSFEPGQSMVTVEVRDDSVLLNRREGPFSRDDRTDEQIVRDIINEAVEDVPSIARQEVDNHFGEAEGEARPFRANDTPIRILRRLADVHEKHVYVLPGERPGQSVIYFQDFPDASDRQAGGLPPLVVMGAEANARDFRVRCEFTRPAEVYTSTIRISDKGIVSSSASFRDRELLGERPALPEGEQPARRAVRSRPGTGGREEQAVASESRRSSFAYEAEGSVIDGCYDGVLRPYQLVPVRVGETPLSGTYRIKSVTHQLTRSTYSQSFELTRNAESETSREGLARNVRSIF